MTAPTLPIDRNAPARCSAGRLAASPIVRILLLAAILPAGCARPPLGLFQIRSWDGVVFIERGGTPLRMDVFAPDGLPDARPGVILVHGGGWQQHDRRVMRPMAAFLASMGYVAAAIDYRLTPTGAIYPEQVRDCLAAVQFLRARAADYRLDPARLAICGDSAGGQLSLLVGLARDPALFAEASHPGVPADMQAIVNIYGPTDMAALYRDTLLAVRPCVRRYLGGRPDEQPDRYREASPVSHVRADAPPVLTLHGECDSVVPVSQGQALHDALTAAGAKSTLIRVARGRHAWCDDFAGLDSQRTLPAIIQFLSDTLGPGARPHPES